MKLSGGCLCGQVRYSAEAEPAFVRVCHCKNCQKQAGSAFSVNVGVPKAALVIEGTLKSYADTGDSGMAVSRRFCPNCGSPVLSEPERMPDLTILKAGTLDETGWLKPTTEIFCDSAETWLQLGGGMQRFPRMPG